MRPRCLPLVAGLLLWATALLLNPTSAQGQEVRFTPRADRPPERRLSSFLERSEYELWSRDTVLARGDTVPQGLLVLESMVRLAGRVEGDVFVVDGDLFLRPGSDVTGDVVVLGGGFYSSNLARVQGEVIYRPNLFFQAIPADGGWEIYATREMPERFEADGLYGIRFPEVNRVDGWTPSLGARLTLVDVPGQPSLHAVVSYRTERGEPGGRLEHYWHPTGRLRVGLELERTTASHDRWLRGEPANTLAFVLAGRDHRDHYEADRWGIHIDQHLGRGDTLSLRVGAEEARSLPARMGNVLFGADHLRPNPPVDEGTTWSLTLGGRIREEVGPGRLRGSLDVEAADSSVAGDFSYLLGRAHLGWTLPLPNDHRIDAELVGRGDLAGSLPRQRWSAVGGPGTLPTFPVLSVRGPRLLMAAATYRIPVPQLRVARLGAPEVYAGAVSAAAWGPGTSPVFRENLRVGVRFLGLELTGAVDPSSGETVLVLGFRLRAGSEGGG